MALILMLLDCRNHKDSRIELIAQEFDLYFRKNPFGGEYTIFAGLEECIKFIAHYKLTDDEITFIRSSLPPSCEDAFYNYLRGINCSDIEIYSIPEGSVVFPKVPLMRIEGPIAVVQLLETAFVNLINYASLVTTNAARHRFVVGKSKLLLEFGLRRAQGPDGGISASRYCYMGGFDATSNVAAGNLFGIPLRGTHSHAFVSSFMSPDEIKEKSLKHHGGSSVCKDFVSLVKTWLGKLKRSRLLGGIFNETNQSELAAFTSYGLAFPGSFLALVDTYDVMRSGVPNFCAVALALNDLGYSVFGIRLDSGDLAYQSCEARKFFQTIEKEFGVPGFGKMNITASNDLNEETLDALKKQGHDVDSFGIGTHLVTCYAQPALGVVFKLVEINNQPRIKLSEEVTKVSIPCKKRCFRLYGKEGYPLVDIMTGENERPPKVGERILCRHPFIESKRAYVVPQRIEELLKCFWPGSSAVGSASACSGTDVKFLKYLPFLYSGRLPVLDDKQNEDIGSSFHYSDLDYLFNSNVDANNNIPSVISQVGYRRVIYKQPPYLHKVIPLTTNFQHATELCLQINCSCKNLSSIIEKLDVGVIISEDKTREDLPPLKEIRKRCIEQLEQMRPDHMRRLNPTPYKVSVSGKLYDFIHFLWLNEAPVGELQ
ncbi:Nicotinate phosphoribosyltransferase [Capsicum annuum]|nr:Nicotinate phosphoribosyltransferase [Capsicum annuum]